MRKGLRVKATGVPIIGTAELVPGTALASEWEVDASGVWQPVYEGETALYWEGQRSDLDSDGGLLYSGDDGRLYIGAELELFDAE